MDKVIYPLAKVQLSALLGEMADADGGARLPGAAVRGQVTGKQLQKSRFAGSVLAHDADPVGAQKGAGEIPDHRPTVIALSDPVQFDDLNRRVRRVREAIV